MLQKDVGILLGDRKNEAYKGTVREEMAITSLKRTLHKVMFFFFFNKDNWKI